MYDTPVHQSRTLGTHYTIHKLCTLSRIFCCEISIFLLVFYRGGSCEALYGHVSIRRGL